MAPNLSTTPPKSDVKKKTSLHPKPWTQLFGGTEKRHCRPWICRLRPARGFWGTALLAAVYTPLVPVLNFFMPTQKLKSKMRVGSKEIKVYDEPWSPFRGSWSVGVATGCKDALTAQCAFATRWNFSRMSTRLSGACISGSTRQTVFRRRSRASFGNMF
jgi:hypothetical protein